MTIQQAQQTLRQIVQIAQQLEQEEQVNAQKMREQSQNLNQHVTQMGGLQQQIGERERNAALQLEKIQDLASRCEHEMME